MRTTMLLGIGILACGETTSTPPASPAPAQVPPDAPAAEVSTDPEAAPTVEAVGEAPPEADSPAPPSGNTATPECKQSCIQIATERFTECAEDQDDIGKQRCELEQSAHRAMCLAEKCGDSSEADALDAASDTEG